MRRLRVASVVALLLGCQRTAPAVPELVEISAGSYLMGCVPVDPDCHVDEQPRHQERLPAPIWMQRTETTVGEWREFARATGYPSEAERAGRGRMFVVAHDAWEWIEGLSWATPLTPGDSAPDNWPAVQVSPADAEAFCRWLGGRLPSEVEWERAARGGEEGRIHVWGDDSSPLRDGKPQVNGPDRLTLEQFPRWKVFGDYIDGYATLAPVGSFPVNGYGLADMAGNAYEWTADSYDSMAYRHSANRVPLAESVDSSMRVVRGGGWGYEPDHFRISFRGYFEARGFWTATVGFRCVRDRAP